jgi:very-short-patch-repair endonuclease
MRARHSHNHPKSSQLQHYAAQHRAAPTESEARLWSALSAGKLGVAFRRQVVLGNRFIVDFVAPRVRLVVEVDGSYHAQRIGADARRGGKLRRLGFVCCGFRRRWSWVTCKLRSRWCALP